MASPLREDVEQYMARSERTLEAAQVLAEHGYWGIDRRLHRMLIDMLDERHVADYRIEIEITQEEAEQGLRAAREFVRAIREYLESEEGR